MISKSIQFTSANMDKCLYDMILNASNYLKIPRHKIFIDIINITVQNMNCGHAAGRLTEYQDHSPEQWKKFHYQLDENEIENFSKIRHKYKLSISKLAFIGFLLFWDLLMYKYKIRVKTVLPKDLLCSYSIKIKKSKEFISYYMKKFEIRKIE